LATLSNIVAERVKAPFLRWSWFNSTLVVVLPDPFWGMGRGGTPRRPNSRATPQGLDQMSKMEEVVPKMRAGEAQMRDNPGGDELNP